MHPKTKRASRCYRVQYRSLERTLPGDEVEVFQQKLAQKLVELYGVEIR